MSLPLWHQVPKRGKNDQRTLVVSTAACSRISREEVRPLRAHREVKTEVSRRSLGGTLILANIGLTSCTKTSLQLVLGLDQPGDHGVVGVTVEGDGPHHSSLGLAQKLRNAAHRSLLLSLAVKRSTNRGITRDGPSHANRRSSEVHVLRNGPQRVSLSNLNGRGDHRLNERHDKGGMWVQAPLLEACKTNLMPKIVRHIQTLAGVVMDVAHDSDRRAAAVSLIPRLGIQCPKDTLVEELIRLLPDRDIIGPPMSSSALKTRLDKAQAVIL
jgi:hypothetical protein